MSTASPPASGQQFALLPPDNAAGNSTEIVQRIPVRIAIDATDRLREGPRPGMSVTATIDTKAPSAGATQLPLSTIRGVEVSASGAGRQP